MADPTRSTDPPPASVRESAGPPRWVKLFGVALALLVLLLLAMMLLGGGEHGPGRHGSTGGSSLAAVPPSHAGDR